MCRLYSALTENRAGKLESHLDPEPQKRENAVSCGSRVSTIYSSAFISTVLLFVSFKLNKLSSVREILQSRNAEHLLIWTGVPIRATQPLQF